MTFYVFWEVAHVFSNTVRHDSKFMLRYNAGDHSGAHNIERIEAEACLSVWEHEYQKMM